MCAACIRSSEPVIDIDYTFGGQLEDADRQPCRLQSQARRGQADRHAMTEICRPTVPSPPSTPTPRGPVAVRLVRR
jgi:hypothetical protein